MINFCLEFRECFLIFLVIHQKYIALADSLAKTRILRIYIYINIFLNKMQGTWRRKIMGPTVDGANMR